MVDIVVGELPITAASVAEKVVHHLLYGLNPGFVKVDRMYFNIFRNRDFVKAMLITYI